MSIDQQQKAITALFEISEKPIQQWITKQIDDNAFTDEVFNNTIEDIRVMTMVHAADPSKCFAVSMQMIKSDVLQTDERKIQITNMRNLIDDFKQILHAYTTSVNIVYTGTMNARDFDCTNEKFEEMKKLSFKLDTEQFVMIPLINGEREYKSNYTLVICADQIAKKEISNITGLPVPENDDNEFINPDYELSEADFRELS